VPLDGERGGLGRIRPTLGREYTITPCGFVPARSAIKAPENLADVPVHVRYQSGSHYTTIQASEPFLPGDRIKLTFGGSPADRADQLLDGSAAAATVFGAQYYLMEQLGFRKIVDATFMIAAMVPSGVELDDVRRYFGALRRAQADIDISHQPYTRISRLNYRNGIGHFSRPQRLRVRAREQPQPIDNPRKANPGERDLAVEWREIGALIPYARFASFCLKKGK